MMKSHNLLTRLSRIKLPLYFRALLILSSSTTFPFVGIPEAGFNAIPSLESSNQELYIAFVSFNGDYLTPSNDLRLRAHQEIHSTQQQKSSNSLYRSIFKNPRQFITIAAQNDVVMLSSIDTFLSNMDVPLLVADLSYVSISEGLASNQLIVETTNWVATAINILQCSVVKYATGPPGKFSTLSLCTILVVELVVILVSLWIESLVISIQLRINKGRDFQKRWYLDSTLPLHRMVFESAGLGLWKNCPREISVTDKTEKISVGREWDNRISLKEKIIERILLFSLGSLVSNEIIRETTVKSDRETLLKRQFL
jgi:hypothetical protein